MGAAPTMETTPMTQLSDTQAVILSAAAQRDDRNVLPLPGSLRGGAATKVIGALLSRGLIAESMFRENRRPVTATTGVCPWGAQVVPVW